MNEEVSRRHWLVCAVQGMVTATLLVIVYPISWFLKPRKATQQPGMEELVAPYRMNDLVPDSEGNWPAPFPFSGKPCLLIKTEDGEVRAFNAICTHTDCTVKYRVQEQDLFCSCHNGVYDLAGRNVSGPPPRPLETFPVELRGSSGQEEIIVQRN